MDSHNSKVKNINALLNTPKTRQLGLRSLNSYLQHCPDDVFIDYCISWMQNCCKSDGSKKEVELSIQTLSKLFETSKNYPELNKNVSFFITNRFFDHFFKYFASFNSGWGCAKNCFLFYRGPCGPSEDAIAKHLMNKLLGNEKISDEVAHCCALLPSLGGGGNDGVNYKKNWKNQFLKYIHTCHTILNDLFVGVDELQMYDTYGSYNSNQNRKCDSNHLVTILYNNCKVLSSMLLGSYPAPKSVSTDVVLELICRGLAVNPTTLGRAETTSLLSLQQVLHKIHVVLLDLLSSLITTCKNQLLPNSYLICKLIKQTLESTQSSFTKGQENDLTDLKIETYIALCNWLQTAKSGSCVNTIAKTIISHVIHDVEIKTNLILLKETKSTGGTANSTKESTGRKIDRTPNSCLCYSALVTIQYLVKFCGVLLKSEDHKYLQEIVVRLLVNIQRSFSTDIPAPYSVPKCRKALYGVLVELVYQPCPTWPPPTHFALRLLKNGQNDCHLETGQFCSTALNAITVIIHHQFSNGPYLTADGMNYGNQQPVEGDLTMDIDVTTADEMYVGNEKSINDAMLTVEEGFKTPEPRRETEETLLRSESCETYKSSSPEKRRIEKVSKGESEGTEVVEEPEIETEAEEETAKSEYKSKEQVEKMNLIDEEDNPTEGKQNVMHEEPSPKKMKANEEGTVDVDQSSRNSTPSKTSTLEWNKSRSTTNSPSDPNKSEKNVTTPEKAKMSENSDVTSSPPGEGGPNNEKSVTPELTTDYSKYVDFKKRYFLRSKGKGGSEEPEEVLKRNESIESPRSTPTRMSGRSTPLSVSRRPRTRALSKLEEHEYEPDNTSKDTKDDEDIIEAFDDTLAE